MPDGRQNKTTGEYKRPTSRLSLFISISFISPNPSPKTFIFTQDYNSPNAYLAKRTSRAHSAGAVFATLAPCLTIAKTVTAEDVGSWAGRSPLPHRPPFSLLLDDVHRNIFLSDLSLQNRKSRVRLTFQKIPNRFHHLQP